MPRFSEQEKVLIQKKLLTEGERLFSGFGLKKVRVDDIAAAADVSKGSFYAFYESKETLFMDISVRFQQKIWKRTNVFLEKHKHLPSKTLFKKCFLRMFSTMKRYPMFLMMDRESTEQLYRKLPPNVIEDHTKEDEEMLYLLEKYGICFKYNTNLAASILQTLALSFLNLQHDKNDHTEKIMDIMLDGVINELIEG